MGRGEEGYKYVLRMKGGQPKGLEGNSVVEFVFSPIVPASSRKVDLKSARNFKDKKFLRDSFMIACGKVTITLTVIFVCGNIVIHIFLSVSNVCN